MFAYAPSRSSLLCSLFVVLSFACDGETAESVAGMCPTGPTAPLGGSCDTPGLVCTYGYQSRECGGRTVKCTRGAWAEVEHTDPAPACQAGAPDAGRVTRALPLANLTRVTVSRLYCGAVLSSCGGGLGPTIDYTIDLAASTLTTQRCTPSDAGRAGRPETQRAVTGEQLAQIQAGLAALRVADAELMYLDGMMQALTLTYADGTTRRYSPAAACGERRYEQVVEGFRELWDRIASLDPA